MEINPAGLPAVKTKRTFELIVDLLKERILSGEFSPGDRLPAERNLAEALGVGRPSVREAYRALELMGILEIRKGIDGGAFIVAPSNQSTSETITDLMRMHHVELATLAEARLFIEKGTAELAAGKASPTDIECLEFHLKIAEAGANPLLCMSLTSVMELMRRELRRRRPSAETSKFELREHRKLLKAIKERDAEQAVLLMDLHLRRSLERLQKKTAGADTA
jgi:GntR family transcriptional repressor for pyruvate dehydrogenase complex